MLSSLCGSNSSDGFHSLKTASQGLFGENREKKGCFGGLLKTLGCVVGVFIEGQANPTWRERASPEGSRALAIKSRICFFCSDDWMQQNRKRRLCNKLFPFPGGGMVPGCSVGLETWIWGCGDVGPTLRSSVSPPGVQILQDSTRSSLQCNPSSFLAAGISGKLGAGQEGLIPAEDLQGSKVPDKHRNLQCIQGAHCNSSS